MVDSVTNGFIRRSQSSQDPMQQGQPNNLNYKEEQVRKSLMEFSKRFGSSISAVTKLLGTMEDSRDKRELDKALKKANSITSLMQKLKEGKGITPKEARELIDNAELLNKLIVSDDKVRKQLKELGYKAEDLDITKPLRTASQKIGESAKELFINNAERLSRSDVAQDIAKTGVRAVSPELAFITESLGVGLPNLFESQNDEEDEVVTELDKLNTSVENLEDSFIKAQEDGTKATVKAQQASTKAEVDLTKKQIISDKRNTNDIIYADSAREETLTTIRADQHQEQMEILDDIKDGQQKSLFSKLADFLKPDNLFKRSAKAATAGGAGGFLAGAGGKIKEGAKTIGRGVVKAGKMGLKGAALGAGVLLGVDALQNVRKEGLTTGNALQSGASGALIGSAFGPLGALIGGGVGILAAIITDAISPEDMKSIEKGFNFLSDFILKGVSKGIKWVVKATKDAYKWVTSFSFSEWFKSVGDFISSSVDKGRGYLETARNTVNSWVDSGVQMWDSAMSKLGSGVDFLANGIKSIGKWFSDKFANFDGAALLGEVTSAVFAPFKAIASFITNPKETLMSAFNMDQTGMDAAIKSITDFILAPVRTIKEAIESTANFLGFGKEELMPGSTTSNPEVQQPNKVIPGYEEHSILGFIKDRYEAFTKVPEGNTNIAKSIPENDTSNLGTPKENQSAPGLEAGIAQSQAAKAVSDSVNQQSEQQQKRDKENAKTMNSIVDSKKDKSSYKGQRNMNTSPVQTSDVGLTVVLGNGG